MKKRIFISALVALSLIAFNRTIAFYGDDEGEDQQDCHDDANIDGNETLHAKVILVATTNAPDGATGCAKLDVENEDGVLTTELKIKTTGLAAGTYNLSAIKKSDGTEVALGSITLSCSDDQDEEGDDQDEDESHEDMALSSSHEDGDVGDHEGDHNGGDCHCGTNGALHSESEVTLPADLDPMDIGQIVLSDTDGNALLVGDFVNTVPGTTVTFKACVNVSPDQGAPGCQGTAQVLSTAKKGKHKNRFTMVASGVPANTTFNVQMNGTSVGSAKSNKKGKVLVKKLPANLLTIRSVQLKDAQGHTAANAKF